MAVRKHISADALVNNCRYIKKHCAPGALLAVVKNNAYGHGLEKVAAAIENEVDGFAVAGMSDAVALRALSPDKRIVVLHGAKSADETADDIKTAHRSRIDLVVHSDYQLDLLEKAGDLVNELALWIKFNTGMNRLGFCAGDHESIMRRVESLKAREIVLMSHLACANDKSNKQNVEQIKLFDEIVKAYDYPASFANSAACFNFPETRMQWTRAGLAVYGLVPDKVAEKYAQQLMPAMRVTAPVIAIRTVRAGQRIGYDGAYRCANDTRVAVIAIGYGTGYPRHAKEGTPVYIKGKTYPLVGCVSMDMVTVALDIDANVDAGADADVRVGDEAECWGDNLSASVVAKHSDTISYDLLCAMSHANSSGQ